MRKIMAKNMRHMCGAVLLALTATNGQAQTWVEGPAACLGPTMPYKPYPVETMKKVQGNLWKVYHQDPLWDRDSQIKTLNGTALADGVMGPVTWSWMNRLCSDFWLPLGGEAMGRLPDFLDAMAVFADKHAREFSVLTSSGFATWLKAQADNGQIKAQMAKGDEQDLLALVKRYEAVPPPPKLVGPEVESARNTFYRYVLRKDDYEAFAKPGQPNSLAINNLNAIYDSPDKLKAAITAAVAKLPPERQEKATQQLLPALAKPEEVYQLTEAKLNTLDQAGLTAFEFVELNKLADTLFTDAKQFKTRVNEALTLAGQNLQASAPAEPDAAESAADADSLLIADMERVQIRVFNAAKGYRLHEQDVKKLAAQFNTSSSSLEPMIIKAIERLENIEYPDGNLLHHAAMDKLAQALDVCDENESVSVDILAPKFTPEEKQKLRALFNAAVASQSGWLNGENTICDADFWSALTRDYENLVAPAVEQRYREDAPPYEAKNNLWSGSDCGCIPDEINATAYGIYPYWAVSDKYPYGGGDKPFNFDFSTFSRVGYYGFSFNSQGEFTQPGSKDPRQALFDPYSETSREFISVARTYGSKVDWIIEKDWNEVGSDKLTSSHLRETLRGLQNNIVGLLKTHMKGKQEYLRPLLTLGVEQRPSMGDGVTLYFKHYPQNAEAKAEFENFFRQLKNELRKLSDERSKWNTQEHDFFVNLIVDQEEYLNPDSPFSNINVLGMIGIPYDELSQLTSIEVQQATKTLILVLIKNPYFNSLQKMYSSSTSTYRGYVLPTIMIDYKDFSTGAHSVKEKDKRTFFDERRKVVSYQREAFGGGAYWYMPTWDAAGTSNFNNYIATSFALGYPSSQWYSTLCAYRWQLLAIMNIWLLTALVFVTLVFYVFPYRCHPLPGVVTMLINPVVLGILIIPPVMLWCYLQWMDARFPLLSLPSLLVVVLISLSVWAGVQWIRELRQRKPSRNLAQLQAAGIAYPRREAAVAAPAQAQVETQQEPIYSSERTPEEQREP
jgi:hypothetical protein